MDKLLRMPVEHFEASFSSSFFLQKKKIKILLFENSISKKTKFGGI